MAKIFKNQDFSGVPAPRLNRDRLLIPQFGLSYSYLVIFGHTKCPTAGGDTLGGFYPSIRQDLGKMG
jgi:hypothetical protein